MLNINELESKWLRYKIKSYIPHLIIFISLIVIISVAMSFNFPASEKTQTKESKQEIQPIQVKPITVVEQVVIKQKKKIPVTIKKEVVLPTKVVYSSPTKKTIIKPSLSFMNNLKRTSPEYYQEENIVVPSRPIQQEIKTVVKPLLTPKKEIIVEAPEVEIVKDSTISIQRQNTHEDIQHVVKRFKQSNNPALSLFVAKKYYELGDYHQSYNYALITNELNNDIEDSWIIFAKSLFKLGKKDKAISILKKYISNSHSQRAKILLDNIKSGKIK